MREIDFDRAFPETPAEIRSAIDKGIERGMEQMKMRHKLTTALSIAAACVILTAVVALAAVTADKDNTDTVTAVQQPIVTTETEEKTDDGGINALIAQPAVIGGADAPTAIVLVGDGAEMGLPMIYANPEGTVYHVNPACAGEVLVPVTREYVKTEALKPCEECTMPFAEFVRETADPTVFNNGGKYCHFDPECSGMENAAEYRASAAVDMGLTPCPICMTDYCGTVYLFRGEDGGYFHTSVRCESLAEGVLPEEATRFEAVYVCGKMPCPICMEYAVEHAALIAVSEAPDPNTVVYLTEFGVYYHADSGCSGMEDASESTVSEAEAAGKKMCPICMADIP